MKITFQWLKEYVDFDGSPEDLAERLTMLGLEVERLDRVGGGFEGIVVAEILSKNPHPNADRLSLCQVKDGKGNRQIVCGANNFEAGDKVPLILPGARLPSADGDGKIIKTGKIRGIESRGMLCSGQELGMSDDAEGLMILDSRAQIGQSFAEYLGLPSADFVYDIEVTPNRSDWNSVIGIAREIAALTNSPLKIPQTPVDEFAKSSCSPLRVQIEDSHLCSRYLARVIRKIQIAPSPSWLVQLLEKLGMRSVNNVVDITNFVMLETGHPLHAFDFHLLARQSPVIIRPSKFEESFTTLDGRQHILPKGCVMIADEKKAIALGGIMGGLNTEVGNETTDILLESAHFNPQNIRATSKKLGLRTEASYRFERGVDAEGVDWASRRASSMIMKMAGGELQSVSDAYPHPFAKRQIALRYERTNRLLGVSIPAKTQRAFLERLQIPPCEKNHEESNVADRFSIPSFRIDLKAEADLIEEIARFFGIDKIPSTPPRAAIGRHAFDSIHDDLALMRRVLIGMGFFEVQGQTLISDKSLAPKRSCVALEHPLSSEMNLLRPSLLPGLINVLEHNANHGTQDVSIFEMGNIFLLKEGEAHEKHSLGLAMSGRRARAFWGEGKAAHVDLFDLKGCLEELFDAFGIRGLRWRRLNQPDALFLEEGEMQIGNQILGRLGQMQSLAAAKAGLRNPVYLAELDLDFFQRRIASRSFKAPALFPAIRRDVAMSIDEAISHDAVLQTIKKAKAPFLDSVMLFDVFRGKGIVKGKKSVAYALIYRRADRTLKDAEVAKAHEKVITHLRQDLKATIR